MFEDDIKAIDEWFDQNKSYYTYRDDKDYVIGPRDVEAFMDFLEEKFTDFLWLDCRLRRVGLHFTVTELMDARFL